MKAPIALSVLCGRLPIATGWSVDYILNKVNYQTLIMMLSDAPRYVRDKSGSSGPADERSAEDEADGIVGFFQSKLK